MIFILCVNLNNIIDRIESFFQIFFLFLFYFYSSILFKKDLIHLGIIHLNLDMESSPLSGNNKWVCK